MKDKFEAAILESGDIMRRGAVAVVNNVGKVIATITLLVSALVLFCDVRLSALGTGSFSSTLVIMLACSYLMFFSMNEAGENTGEGTEEYKSAAEKYRGYAALIKGDAVSRLRCFCKKYSADEQRYRRESFLMRYGYGMDEYELYKSGKSFDRAAVRVFKKADGIRAVPLTPKTLLSTDTKLGKSEIADPSGSRFSSILLRLIPSTVCMTVTVSVILTAKDGLSSEIILDGLFKLSSIIIVGLKGYVTGYRYKKETFSLWLETKSRLIEAFLEEEKTGVTD